MITNKNSLIKLLKKFVECRIYSIFRRQSPGSIVGHWKDWNKLSSWLGTNNTEIGLKRIKFIQFMKNRVCHFGINHNPYEALFSCKVSVGLTT